MLLSVVVVNWNSIDDLRDCLLSLRQQTHRELEVIVIDNGSSDGSGEMVTQEFPEFMLLAQGENLGFAEACNRGIDVAKGEWVAMLNNDAVAEANWAEALVDAALGAAPDCGMLQSLLLYKSRPGIINSTGIQLTRSGFGCDRFEGQPRSSNLTPEAIFCPTAGAAAYRMSMLREIRISTGYFDRNHFMYYEDLDLGWRARLAGYSATYIPRSVVHHRWHGSSDRHGATWLVILADTNRVRTLIKNASVAFLCIHIISILNSVSRVLRAAGRKGVATLRRAVVDSLAIRKEVQGLSKARRRSIEKRWQN